MSQDALKLAEHIVKTNEAIAVLFKNKHHESALILLFSWVDRLAWFSIENDDSTGADFKSWLDKYLFINGCTLECNANDLWAARCGLLHTGTAEARDVKKGNARLVYYFSGPIHVTAKNLDKEVYVNTGDLHLGLIGASSRFLTYLEKNLHELEITNSKLGKVLVRTTDI